MNNDEHKFNYKDDPFIPRASAEDCRRWRLIIKKAAGIIEERIERLAQRAITQTHFAESRRVRNALDVNIDWILIHLDNMEAYGLTEGDLKTARQAINDLKFVNPEKKIKENINAS